jgi:transcriptional regulator with XRE-family HTH domain
MQNAPVELGNFLRSRRQRLTPEEVGLPAGRRRRTPGLRREEVAERAGIGVDWYVRLEQGRSVSPSPATLDALAKAMNLTKAEHAHLRALAHGPERQPLTPEIVPPTVRRIVTSLNRPAYVTGRRWDVLAWNKAADDIFGFSKLPDADLNIMICTLARPAARQLFGTSWASEAKRMIALFRASADLWGHDSGFKALIARLMADVPEFAKWWEAHDVRAPAAGRKTLTHRKKGAMSFEYASFQSNDEPGLKLAIYTPAVSATRASRRSAT